MVSLTDLEFLAGRTLFDYQADAISKAEKMAGPQQRVCLYYKTGAGKSLTALGMLAVWGHDHAVVVSPPSTHDMWVKEADMLGMTVDPMSHARFRMKSTLLSRQIPLIADEMHMFGGHEGKGWKKLNQLSLHLQAPLVMASATPNYNDAERVYCIRHILDPAHTRGGYIQFLYQHCTTEENPFGMIPKVTGFHRFKNAAEYLASLKGVFYLPDDLVFTITDIPVAAADLPELDRFGFNRRDHRMLASGMEERHTRTFQGLVDEHYLVHDHVVVELLKILEEATTPVLVFSMHASIAGALSGTLYRHGYDPLLLTGGLTTRQKQLVLDKFRFGNHKVLIGTAALATGTDGLDKICDWLVILDDTDDDALRRQLVGRIMPRGIGASSTTKKVYRLVLT